MKFHRVTKNNAHDFDPATGFRHKMVSENNLVQIGVYRVMYGNRVRAGFVDDHYGVALDWCGGGNWEDVERLYSLAVAILSKREENRRCFEGLPVFSTVKPFYKDAEFMEVVSSLAGDFELLKMEEPFRSGIPELDASFDAAEEMIRFLRPSPDFLAEKKGDNG